MGVEAEILRRAKTRAVEGLTLGGPAARDGGGWQRSGAARRDAHVAAARFGSCSATAQAHRTCGLPGAVDLLVP